MKSTICNTQTFTTTYLTTTLLFVICIKLHHFLKGGPTHSYNDDGHGEKGRFNDGSFGLIHVSDVPIGQNKYDKVALSEHTCTNNS